MQGLPFFNLLHAVEIENITASKTGDRYDVELMVLSDIPEAFAREILEDPDRVVQVNDELLAVHHLASEQPGVRRLRDHTRVCVWFFCVNYENTLNMRILENRDIQLTVDPSQSEFNYGVFTWHTESVNDGQTRLIFHSESEPGFWVPTTNLLVSRMRKGIREMVLNMECEYRQKEQCAELEWQDSTQLNE